MIDEMKAIAQTSELPVTSGGAAGFMAGVAATAAAAWGWFRGELTECREDRKKLHEKVEKLHEDIAGLSIRVGNCERQDKSGGS